MVDLEEGTEAEGDMDSEILYEEKHTETNKSVIFTVEAVEVFQ
jgi:hypothetical protein